MSTPLSFEGARSLSYAPSLRVARETGELLTRSRVGYSATATQTRPDNTTAYTALDVVGADPAAVLEFANIGPAGEHIEITASLLRIDINAVPSGMAGQRLHLFNAAPTAIADNAAFDLPSGDRAKYLGFIDLGTPIDLGATLAVQSKGQGHVVKLATGVTSLFGVLQTIDGYTPASQTVTTITLRSLTVG